MHTLEEIMTPIVRRLVLLCTLLAAFGWLGYQYEKEALKPADLLYKGLKGALITLFVIGVVGFIWWGMRNPRRIHALAGFTLGAVTTLLAFFGFLKGVDWSGVVRLVVLFVGVLASYFIVLDRVPKFGVRAGTLGARLRSLLPFRLVRHRQS
jgi:hypothetical protein